MNETKVSFEVYLSVYGNEREVDKRLIDRMNMLLEPIRNFCKVESNGSSLYDDVFVDAEGIDSIDVRLITDSYVSWRTLRHMIDGLTIDLTLDQSEGIIKRYEYNEKTFYRMENND